MKKKRAPKWNARCERLLAFLKTRKAMKEARQGWLDATKAVDVASAAFVKAEHEFIEALKLYATLNCGISQDDLDLLTWGPVEEKE